jgi:hypothetical protein
LALSSTVLGEVRISETTYEERPQLKIETARATYFLDRAGGGFSRLFDGDGKDWIAFHRDPLKDFPAAAAAGYRGIPNLVFGSDNPDAGAGHPGFEQCTSQQDGADAIVCNTRSGKWQWRWHFTDSYATLTVTKADSEHPYWFLYEGPVGGKWSPHTHYFGSDTAGTRREVPDSQHKLFERWRWAYFGDDSQSRVLLIAHLNLDQLDDTLWYLGNSDQGIASEDGMIVFGFGRGDGTRPLLRGADQSFRLGFVESSVENNAPPSHQTIARTAEKWIENWIISLE